MSRYRVELAPEALEQAGTIDDWWRASRRAAPNPFVEELAVAVERLHTAPHTAAPYEGSGATAVRRLLLPRTRHHVYLAIAVSPAVVRIHAIWHSARGQGPKLR